MVFGNRSLWFTSTEALYVSTLRTVRIGHLDCRILLIGDMTVYRNDTGEEHLDQRDV